MIFKHPEKIQTLARSYYYLIQNHTTLCTYIYISAGAIAEAHDHHQPHGGVVGVVRQGRWSALSSPPI